MQRQDYEAQGLPPLQHPSNAAGLPASQQLLVASPSNQQLQGTLACTVT